MAKIHLTYYVHLTDEAWVTSLTTLYPNGLNRAPYNPGPPPGGAAVEFSAPLQLGSEAFVAPCIRSSWFLSNPDFPRNVAVFTKTNWFLRIVSFGFLGSTKFYWIARFGYSPKLGGAAATGTERAKIPQRRWIEGFEQPDQGGGATQTNFASYVSRDASRTIDGYGLAYRSAVNLTHQFSLDQGGVWQRLYLRPRVFDSSEIWRTRVQAEAGAGFSIELTATGQIAVFKNSTTTKTLLGTVGSLVIGKWYRFDLIVGFKAGAGGSGWDGKLLVYVNGSLLTTVYATGGGSGTLAKHNYSTLGESRTLNNNLCIDLDDWIGADMPDDKDANAPAWATATNYGTNDRVVSGASVYRCLQAHLSGAGNAPGNTAYWVRLIDSQDWSLGGHAQVVKPATVVTATNWTGAPALVKPRPVRTDLTGGYTSSTALAVLGLATDIEISCKQYQDVLGWAGLMLGSYDKRGAGADGRLGYKIGTAGVVWATITQATSYGWHVVTYAPAGLTAPQAIQPIELHFEKGNDASLATIAVLMAQVNLLGIFGEVDLPKDSTAVSLPPPSGTHNAPYPRAPWARSGLATVGPVRYTQGSYVGTGAALTLEFDAPVCFLWIRPVTGDSGGVRWWSSLLGSHKAQDESPLPELSPDQLEDLTYTTTKAYLVELGTHAQVNANGVTYQYLAVMDPGARFFMSGAFAYGPSSAGAIYPYEAPLDKLAFTPEFALLLGERPGTTTTSRLYGKGIGHAADAASLLSNGTPVASAFTFGAGKITLGSGAFSTNPISQVSFIAFRRADGNADPDQNKVMAIGSYVGDASASRTITVAGGPGLRPLWVIVIPLTGAAAEMRDPGHTGTTSSAVTGGSVHSSGYIQAGSVDGFSVGASLNASGVTYAYLILWGSATAGNGGWSVAGTYEPVISIPPVDWPGFGGPGTPPATNPPTEDEPPPEAPPIVLPEEPDFDPDDPLPGTDLFCVDFTQRLVNLALLRIGVSKQIADISTETTEEAAVARLHVKYDVQTTLRDFPWPFATKYATLALVTGTPTVPANADWTYAYRRPTDCVFERRLVAGRGDAVNPTPPPFALGRDTGGGLIVCNEAAAVLEYTSRVQCPTYEGDELFKEALTWRFAMSLAAPLTRMREKEEYARQMYDAAIRRAYEVLRPGNPGPRPAVDPTDPDAAASATTANLALVNRALVRIGAQTIAALTDQGREAIAAALIFEDELQSTLRDHPWAFTTRYQDPLTLVGGSAASPVSGDWIFSYRLPAECVFARRLVRKGTGRRYDPAPDLFRTGTDATGGLLFCDIEVPVLEYTARIAGVVLRGDALFRDAFAWRLAASLAPSLAPKEPEAVEQLGRGADATAAPHQQPWPRQGARMARDRMTQYAWAMYRAVLNQARVADAREQQQSHGDDDADWILAR